jgi:hypothetical protein
MPSATAHVHDWHSIDDDGAVARYSCACSAVGRRNLGGRIVEVATVANVDPDDLITARPAQEDVVDCTGRRRMLNPDSWVADDQDDGRELEF